MLLIIEDNENDAALIRRVLSQRVPAEKIRHVTTPDEAARLLETCDGEAPELVLLDLHLPPHSGLEVLERLRAAPQTRHTPIVVMSHSAEGKDVARSYDLGANSFLLKAEDTEAFEFAISQLAPYWLELNQPYALSGAKR